MPHDPFMSHAWMVQAAIAGVGVTHVSLGGPLGADPGEAIRLLGARALPALGR